MNDKILEQLTRIANSLEVLAGQPSTFNDAVWASKNPVEDKPAVDLGKNPETLDDCIERDTIIAAMTHDDLKAICLAKSREDVSNKPKLKALLAEYGAAKAIDVPADKLSEVILKIEQGKF